MIFYKRSIQVSIQKSFLHFRVPPESGEKISLAVTVLLAITVYMMVVMDNVPENSTVVPLLRMYKDVH